MEEEPVLDIQRSKVQVESPQPGVFEHSRRIRALVMVALAFGFVVTFPTALAQGLFGSKEPK